MQTTEFFVFEIIANILEKPNDFPLNFPNRFSFIEILTACLSQFAGIGLSQANENQKKEIEKAVEVLICEGFLKKVNEGSYCIDHASVLNKAQIAWMESALELIYGQYHVRVLRILKNKGYLSKQP